MELDAPPTGGDVEAAQEASTTSQPGPLLIIGIDAADHGRTRRWLDEGRLPNLAELLGRGRLLRGRSTKPPFTAPAWASVATGCNPGKHGIFGFLDLSTPERRPWWSRPRVCPSLWRRISDAGMRCGVLNMPMAYPAEEINGVMVLGFGAAGLTEDAFRPGSLRDELLRAVPDYMIQPDLDPGKFPDADALTECVAMRGRAARFLLARQPFDAFAVVFSALDWAQHGRMCGPDGGIDESVPLRVMQAIDREIADLLQMTGWPRSPVLVVSDHGMRCARRQVNLLKLFAELDLLAVRWSEGGSRSRRALTSLMISGWNWAKRLLPGSLVSRARRAGASRREAALAATPGMEIDWERTLAAPMDPYGSVRLNVRGRDPHGAVPPEDYKTVRGEIAERLRQVTDPDTGRPLFSEVAARDDIYDGPLMGDGPDIVLAPGADDLAFGCANRDEDLILFLQQPGLVTPLVPPWGVHWSPALMLLSGDAVAPGGESAECRLEDLAPTVLHLLGLPIPTYMDGQALVTHLTGEAAEREVNIVEEELPPPEAAASGYTEEQEEQLVQRLRDLGYC